MDNKQQIKPAKVQKTSTKVTKDANGDMTQLVIFELDNEEYAAQITDLQEIIKIPEITQMPNSPDFICGILNLRGKIVVVVDLEKRFNLINEQKKKDQEHIIIIEVADSMFGVLVDKVLEVLQVPNKSIRKTPTMIASKIDSGYINGVVVFEKKEEIQSVQEKNEKEVRLIILLDLPKLLQTKELMQFGQSVRQFGIKSGEQKQEIITNK